MPGTLWASVVDLDLAKDPDLSQCKARAAAKAVSNARSEDWNDNGLLSGYELTREEGVPLVKPVARAKVVATKSGRPMPHPFDLTLGSSSLQDAKAALQREGATITSKGLGEAKPRGRDDDPDGVANPRVEMIDVKGLPVERVSSTRLGFFDDDLYLMKYELEDGADFSKLLLQVVAKYGQPDRSSGGEAYEWQFGDVLLTLEKSFMEHHTMTFEHQPLRRAVTASNAVVYAGHIKSQARRQRGF